MKTSAGENQKILLVGISALALAASPLAFDLTSHSGPFSSAMAQQKGGQGKGGQGGQQGSGRGGKGSGSGSGSAQDVLRGSKPASTGGSGGSGGSGGTGGSGGSGGSSSSGSGKLGRLSMAKSFLSPGFDITKVDDPTAPMAQIYAYSLVIGTPVPADDPSTAENESQAAITAAGTALGNAATVSPVTLSTVKALNTAGGFTTTWTDAQLTQVATVATTVLEARRTEESSTKQN